MIVMAPLLSFCLSCSTKRIIHGYRIPKSRMYKYSLLLMHYGLYQGLCRKNYEKWNNRNILPSTKNILCKYTFIFQGVMCLGKGVYCLLNIGRTLRNNCHSCINEMTTHSQNFPDSLTFKTVWNTKTNWILTIKMAIFKKIIGIQFQLILSCGPNMFNTPIIILTRVV